MPGAPASTPESDAAPLVASVRPEALAPVSDNLRLTASALASNTRLFVSPRCDDHSPSSFVLSAGAVKQLTAAAATAASDDGKRSKKRKQAPEGGEGGEGGEAGAREGAGAGSGSSSTDGQREEEDAATGGHSDDGDGDGDDEKVDGSPSHSVRFCSVPLVGSGDSGSFLLIRLDEDAVSCAVVGGATME